MRVKARRWCWLALPFLLPACEAPPREVAFPAEDRVAVRAVMDGLGERLLHGDWEGAGELFRADAVLLPPQGPPVEGRENIVLALEVRAPGVDLGHASLLTDQVDGGAVVAYAGGTYESPLAADPPEDGVEEWAREGSWLAVLLRNGVEAEEGWRIHRLMWNLDLSPILPEDLPDLPPPGG